jgi:hypothetical protein
MTAEVIAKALGGRKVGGGWMARCPAHNDRGPSLSIIDAQGGKVLVRCHAGCEQADVIAARYLAKRPARPQEQAQRCERARSKHREADRGGACSLAGDTTCQWNARRTLPPFARPTSHAAVYSSLPCRPEASLGRHLAGDGGACDARR